MESFLFFRLKFTKTHAYAIWNIINYFIFLSLMCICLRITSLSGFQPQASEFTGYILGRDLQIILNTSRNTIWLKASCSRIEWNVTKLKRKSSLKVQFQRLFRNKSFFLNFGSLGILIFPSHRILFWGEKNLIVLLLELGACRGKCVALTLF